MPWRALRTPCAPSVCAEGANGRDAGLGRGPFSLCGGDGCALPLFILERWFERSSQIALQRRGGVNPPRQVLGKLRTLGCHCFPAIRKVEANINSCKRMSGVSGGVRKSLHRKEMA